MTHGRVELPFLLPCPAPAPAAEGKRDDVFIRKSRYGWFSQFIYQYKNRAGKYRMVHYTPKELIEGLLLPLGMFEGRVKWGGN